MNKIQYITLDLFIYNLIEVSAKDEYEAYWLNLKQELQKKTSLKEESQEYLIFEISNQKIDGSYSRKRIDDTYSFNYTCSLDREVEVTQITSTLTQLKNLAILPKVSHLPVGMLSEDGYIGQTWMVTGWTSEKNRINQNEAKEIYKFLVQKECEYTILGEFLGATVWEMWRGKNQWEGIEKDSYVIIIFYPDEVTFENVSRNYYPYWQSLFCWKHKIVWAYQQGRKLKPELAKELQSQKNITELSSDLSKKSLGQLKTALQKNSRKLSAYIQNLNWLQIQQHTVHVNLDNYKLRCDKHFEKADWLREFSHIVEEKYKIQLERDYLSLNAGLAILENVTNTIRGMLEIEQTQRDRNFNIVIAMVGVGLATSQIASAVILEQHKPPENVIFFQTKPFLWSLATGAIASFLLWLLLRFFMFLRHRLRL